MAELVDALDLGSNEETRTGSSPARPTKTNNIDNTQVLSIFLVLHFFGGSTWGFRGLNPFFNASITP